MKKITGFTLIELMVTLAVAAILLTVGLPSFKNTIDNNRMATSANKLLSTLITVRSKAVSTGRLVTLCKVANPDTATACSTAATVSWANGAIIWADNNGNATLDAGEILDRVSGLPGKLSLSSNIYTDAVTYNANGRVTAGAGRFTICKDSSVADTKGGRVIFISNVGRPRVTGTNASGYPIDNDGAQVDDC